ncbi:MAG: OpgC domain-containing protein, partial [Blastocatellia bacterium]|nr:OpgC domain-containing protein [Blastocatellia bacterium]
LLSQFGLLALLKSQLIKVLPVDFGFFDIFAWQILYIGGLVCGYHRSQGYSFSFLENRKLFFAALTVASSLFLFRHELIGSNYLPEFLTSKAHMGLLRVVNFAAITYLVASLYEQFKKVVTWKWLISLGQHSLQVYSFQVLLVFFMTPVLPQLRQLPLPVAVLVTALAVASLHLPAWIHKRYDEFREELRKEQKGILLGDVSLQA